MTKYKLMNYEDNQLCLVHLRTCCHAATFSSKSHFLHCLQYHVFLLLHLEIFIVFTQNPPTYLDFMGDIFEIMQNKPLGKSNR